MTAELLAELEAEQTRSVPQSRAMRRRQPATDRQIDVLATIHRLTAEAGQPPTVRELVAAMGVKSTNTIAGHIEALVEHGLVDWRPRSVRGVRLTPAGIAALSSRIPGGPTARIAEIDAAIKALLSERLELVRLSQSLAP